MIYNEFVKDGDIYVFDIDKIMEYVCTSKNKDVLEREITESYHIANDRASLSEKTVKQVSTPMGSEYDNIKYDLIKMFVISLINNEDEYGAMTYGINMAFNTLLSLGLIKKL